MVLRQPFDRLPEVPGPGADLQSNHRAAQRRLHFRMWHSTKVMLQSQFGAIERPFRPRQVNVDRPLGDIRHHEDMIVTDADKPADHDEMLIPADLPDSHFPGVQHRKQRRMVRQDPQLPFGAGRGHELNPRTPMEDSLIRQDRHG